MKLAVLVEFFPPKLGSDRRIYETMKRLSYRHEVAFGEGQDKKRSEGDVCGCAVASGWKGSSASWRNQRAALSREHKPTNN